MADPVVAVVDTNVFLNLATPVVDSRPTAPTGAGPLKALLVSYDVHTPTSVIGELSAATRDDDLLSAAAALVLQASDQLTTCEVSDRIDEPLDYPLVARGVATALWFVWNIGFGATA
jgi:rRNA-processing protein FCF1